MRLIKGLNIHTGTSSLTNGAVLIDGHAIVDIFTADDELPKHISEIIDYPSDYHLIPGLIDMHIHGSQGYDVMDATPEALQIIADSLLQQGTTGFLATTMTATCEKIEAALRNALYFSQQQQHGAQLLGIHLEGPFIAPAFTGAQHPRDIQAPNIELFRHWQTISGNLIKMVTVAPEMENGLALVEYLKQTGVIVSFGHSGADYQTTQAAIDAGVTHATHLFNAMRGIHHREPGAVTALLLRPEVYTELIADGHHLAPDIVDLSYRLKTADKLILVTDATRAQCLGDGCFELGGQEIFVKDRAVRLKNGTLAGSILTLAQAMQFVLQATRCSMNELVKMVSSNPAKQLQLHDQGHISKGLLANLVVLNERLEIIKVITQPTLGVPQP